MTLLGVVLAAGGGARFRESRAGGPKQLADVAGTPLVVQAVQAALGAGLAEVAVVQGAVDLAGVLPASVTILANPRWADGLATSLQVALAHAEARGRTAVVIGLGDQPGVAAGAWEAVAAAPASPPIAVATYEGRRGNPVRLERLVWPMLPITGDEGARAVMRARPELVQEVPCSGRADDIDTVDDLDRWLSGGSAP